MQGFLSVSLNCGSPRYGSQLKAKKWSTKTSLRQPSTLTSDTFNLDGDDSAKLSTCRLQYGNEYYPEMEYDSDFKVRIATSLCYTP